MREWLPADHVVWFLLEVIPELDTAAFHVRPRRAGQGPATGSVAGRAGYDPGMLVGLLIYAYACGETSSRQIERHCHTDVAFRVLCADDIPDHTVIARFRGGHQERFGELFAQVLRLCARAGLGQVGTVAIDGSKFAGDASMSANHSRGWLARQASERPAAAAAGSVRSGRSRSTARIAPGTRECGPTPPATGAPARPPSAPRRPPPRPTPPRTPCSVRTAPMAVATGCPAGGAGRAGTGPGS